MKVIVAARVKHDGQRYEAGDELDLDPAQIAALPAGTVIAEEAVSDPDVLTADISGGGVLLTDGTVFKAKPRKGK